MKVGVTSDPRWRVRLVLLVIALTFPCFIARSQYLTGDPTYYAGVAQSLAAGRGYTFMGRPHTTYPPGLPMLLAPVAALSDHNVPAMQAVIAIFAAGSLAALLAFFREYDPRAEVAIAILVVACFAFFTLATSGIRSEMPYLATSTGALYLVVSGKPRFSGFWYLVLTALLSVATVLLRTIGMSLPAAFLATWITRRIRRCTPESADRALLVGGACGLLAVAMWFAWTRAMAQGSYFDLLRLRNPHEPDLGQADALSILARIPASLSVQITHFAELTLGLPWLLATWLSPLTVFVAVCLTVGLWHELKRPMPVLGWYVLGYGFILLLWPFDEGTRFVFPIFPFLVILGWRGCTLAFDPFVATRDGSPAVGLSRPRWLAIAALALLCLGLIFLRREQFPIRSRQGLAIIAVWCVLSMAGLYIGISGRMIRPRLLPGRALAVFLTAFTLLNLVQTIPAAAKQVTGRDTGAVEIRPAVEWLRSHAAPGDVVMAQPASSIYFYTGLKSVPFPVTRDGRALLTALRQSRPKYLLIRDTPDSPYYFPTEIERLEILQSVAGDGAFSLAYRFPTGRIFSVQ